MIRKLMPTSLILQPVKRRHSDRPKLALSVVSLDKISGNPLLKDLYVRVGVGGRIFFVEGFKDGNYADIFELRVYTPVRIQTTSGEDGSEPLQTGEKYLYTLGRTSEIFGGTREDVLNSCIREEDESVKVFQIFRPTTR